MANRKRKARKAPEDPSLASQNDHGELKDEFRPVNPAFFPFARYMSVVGVHTTLLAFTALFLPRTTLLLEFTKPVIDPNLITSRDRPQHPFLEALTLSPVSTLTCICAGATILQGWWGGWVRSWWIEFSLDGTPEANHIEMVRLNLQKFTVSTFRFNRGAS